ncbi:MAG TPA: LysM peptidoglycan-binding domain-containing protein [Verrucomicrobiae bacterium]
MSLWIRFSLAIASICVCAALGGCMPDQGQSDEEKEPHFVLGQSRVNAMDYQGAAEAFEEAIEVNPHSAQAHYQLAILDENQLSDPAAAIYHYQEYLKFDANAPNAVIVRQHIETCKQQLAENVLSLPASSTTQQQLEKLIEQNRQLQDEVDKWQAYYAAQQSALSNEQVRAQAQAVIVPHQIQTTEPVQPQQQEPVRTQPVQSTGAPVGQSTRSHTVAAGETAAKIARQYGIRLSQLETANPGVNLSRIHIGQVLKIP